MTFLNYEIDAKMRSHVLLESPARIEAFLLISARVSIPATAAVHPPIQIIPKGDSELGKELL